MTRAALALVAALAGHAPAQELRAAIDRAEPSMVMVVASQMKYPDGPTDDEYKLGRRGQYFPRGGDSDPRLNLADPEQAAEHPTGSGLAISADPPLILTSYQLVDKSTRVYVRDSRGRGCYADVHAGDARADLAVLRPLGPLTVAPLRFADVRVAQGPGDRGATVYRGLSVFALGHPASSGFADGGATASAGIVANVRRRSAAPAREAATVRSNRTLSAYNSLLQTDARTALTAPGAGLFNLDGEALGIALPAANADAAGGFAVPFDANTRRIVGALREGREVEYGLLGVTFPRDVAEAEPRGGVAVGSVARGGPADQAGMQPGDVVVAVDGQAVRRYDDLLLTVGAALAGNRVRLTVRRDERTFEAEATLAKLKHDRDFIESRLPPTPWGLRVDWSSVVQGQADPFGRPLPLTAGVAVRELLPKSPAEAKLAPLGDIARLLVTHVDDRPVTTPAQYHDATRGKPSARLRLLNLTPGAPGGRTPAVTLP